MEQTSEDPIVEVVCDFKDSGGPRIMRWKGSAETLDYFDEPSTRHVLGKYFVLIRDAMVLPRIPVPYGSTRSLFDSVRSMLTQQAGVVGSIGSLLTCWAFMSWFADVLPLAPTLLISGAECQGDLLVRALSAVCRYAIMLGGIDPGVARILPVDILRPTLLIYEPQLSAKMVSLLATSKSPGYFIPTRGGVQDLYCPKAIYLGEHIGKQALGSSSISVSLMPASAGGSEQHFLPRRLVSDFQNKLLMYRIRNYSRVRDSEIAVPARFAPGITAMTRVLAAAIVDDDELQQEILSIMSATDEQNREMRRTSLEAIVVEAVFCFCHEPGKQRVLAYEIANKVNDIYKNMRERLQVNEERVGHALKRLGLFTRRLGNEGRGLELAKGAAFLVHKLARLHHGNALFHTQPGCDECQTFLRQATDNK